MKLIKGLLGLSFLTILALLNSCSSSAKFPISRIAPAADISAKKKVNNQKNITLEITARNLASADRMNPPGKNYSIWVVTKDNGIKNVGQLNVRNAKKTTFNTVVPFDFKEIFITVEQQGDLEEPKGVEVARTKI